MKIILFLALSFIFLSSCNSPRTSRKKGYYKIDLPTSHTYQDFSRSGFPYRFQYPTYGTIVQDSTYFEDTPEDNYWINIDFPKYQARIFLSYKAIGGSSLFKVKQADGKYRDSSGINKFENMVNDAFTLTSKNQVVAKYIRDSAFVTANGVSGVYFSVGGDAATGQQFFLTDSTKNFLRGALYFNATPNADSLQPVQSFFKKDILHFIETFRWQ